MTKKVLVPLADGFEDIEAVTIMDVLRRAGCDVTAAGLVSKNVTGALGTVVVTDHVLKDVYKNTFDLIALPGGLPGADHLKADETLKEMIAASYEQGKCTAAICAAPKVLLNAGILKGKNATWYPGALNDEATTGIVNEINQKVVKDGTVITGNGPGSAMEFALELVEELLGSDKRNDVANGLLFQ